MSDTRIRWSNAEKLLIARTTYALMHEQGEDKLNALRKAQKALPEARRRDILTLSAFPWLDDHLKKVGRETAKSKHTEKHKEPSPPEEVQRPQRPIGRTLRIPIEKLFQSAADVVLPHDTEVAAPAPELAFEKPTRVETAAPARVPETPAAAVSVVPPAPAKEQAVPPAAEAQFETELRNRLINLTSRFLSDVLFALLSDPTVQRRVQPLLTQLVKGVLADSLPVALSRPETHKPEAAPSAPHSSSGKTRVLIVGLSNKRDIEEIHREFDEFIDLRFAQPTESVDTLRSQAKAADITIGIADLPEAAERALRSVAPRYQRQPMGLRLLKTSLVQLAGSSLFSPASAH